MYQQKMYEYLQKAERAQIMAEQPENYQHSNDHEQSSTKVHFSTKTHNTGLPYLTHARHSFFQTITKKAKLTKNLQTREKSIEDELIQIEHQRIFRQSSHKANVYEIKYARKQNSERGHKIHLNSTYRKIIMSSRLSPDQTDSIKLFYPAKKHTNQLMKQSPPPLNKYNTLDLDRCENQMFCPRVRNKDIGRKKSELIRQYLSKYNASVNLQQRNRDMKDSMNISNYSVFNEKKTFDELQRLRVTLQQRKQQYANRKQQYLSKKMPINLRYRSQKKQPINKPIHKQQTFRMQNYGPWQNQNPQLEQLLN